MRSVPMALISRGAEELHGGDSDDRLSAGQMSELFGSVLRNDCLSRAVSDSQVTSSQADTLLQGYWLCRPKWAEAARSYSVSCSRFGVGSLDSLWERASR